MYFNGFTGGFREVTPSRGEDSANGTYGTGRTGTGGRHRNTGPTKIGDEEA